MGICRQADMGTECVCRALCRLFKNARAAALHCRQLTKQMDCGVGGDTEGGVSVCIASFIADRHTTNALQPFFLSWSSVKMPLRNDR